MVDEAKDKLVQGSDMRLSTLASTLGTVPGLEFAVLVGSRATGTAHLQSDWDIALQWAHQLDWLTVLAKTETLRRQLALKLDLDPAAIDLIELRRANLAMRASVAEEGIPLVGSEALPWAHFLSRTWRDLEDFYWDKRGAGAAAVGSQPPVLLPRRLPNAA